MFEKSSIYLEKLGHVGLEANLVKGLGSAGKIMGKAIGNIPVVKEGQVDEFFEDSGKHLQTNAKNMEQKVVKQFAILNSPGTNVFLNKMNDMALLFNQTNQIYFDQENVYFMV